MSFQSQEIKMRQLAKLLGNGSGRSQSGALKNKEKFLNISRAFLSALAKDIGLHGAVILSNYGDTAVSGECSLTGMWRDGGIRVSIKQTGGEDVLFYKSVRSRRDHRGGHPHAFSRSEFPLTSYEDLMYRMLLLRKEDADERAA